LPHNLYGQDDDSRGAQYCICGRRCGGARCPRCCPGSDYATTAPFDWPSVASGHFLCVENQIAPHNVVYNLVSDDPLLRIYLIIDDPAHPKVEYPQLFGAYGTRKTIDDPSADPEEAVELDVENPSEVFKDVEPEYSPKDADLTTSGAKPPASG
jgi:hypothetical protein